MIESTSKDHFDSGALNMRHYSASVLTIALDINVEDRLVSLENHTSVHLKVLIQIQPSAIRAGLAVATVGEHPSLLLRSKRDTSLVLGQ